MSKTLTCNDDQPHAQELQLEWRELRAKKPFDMFFGQSSQNVGDYNDWLGGYFHRQPQSWPANLTPKELVAKETLKMSGRKRLKKIQHTNFSIY